MRRRTCLDSAPWFARNPHTIRQPCSRRIPSTRRPGVLPCNEHISPCGSEFGNDISINFPNTGYRTSCRQHAWTCRSRGTSHPGSTDRRRARLQPHSRNARILPWVVLVWIPYLHYVSKNAWDVAESYLPCLSAWYVQYQAPPHFRPWFVQNMSQQESQPPRCFLHVGLPHLVHLTSSAASF